MEFRDLKKQYRMLKPEMDQAMEEVFRLAHFISGPQVTALEKALAEYVGVKHCITCGNGTDALSLSLMAWGIGEGDAVFVPDFTYFSSGEAVSLQGAVPFFVDVDRNYNCDPDKLEEAILRTLGEGRYIPRAVIAVDLFGLPADYARIRPICEKYGLFLLEDGAQGFGGEMYGKRACSFGDISTTSFFPAKPLGCYGDGGAVFTDSDEWAGLLRSYAVHGKGSSKYDNIRIGINSRLDTLQAAVLLVKWRLFPEYELNSINRAAALYNEGLKGTGLILPVIPENFYSSWAQYTVLLPEGVIREKFQKSLLDSGIPSMVYYSIPMHRQSAYTGTVSERADCPVTDEICNRVLSLPIDPYKTEEEILFMIAAVKKILGKENL